MPSKAAYTYQATVLNPNVFSGLFIFPKIPALLIYLDVITLDKDVQNFNNIIYAKNNTPITVSYPAQDKII